MLTILVTLLVVAIIAYVAYLVIGMLHIPQPILTIIYIIVGLVLLLWVLNAVGISLPGLKL